MGCSSSVVFPRIWNPRGRFASKSRATGCPVGRDRAAIDTLHPKVVVHRVFSCEAREKVGSGAPTNAMPPKGPTAPLQQVVPTVRDGTELAGIESQWGVSARRIGGLEMSRCILNVVVGISCWSGGDAAPAQCPEQWLPLQGGGLSHPVLALTPLPNGNLVAGGCFDHAGGVFVNGIARWDGTAWFAMGSGMSGSVRAVTTLSNGDLIAGGLFVHAGGVFAHSIARWDGTAWNPLGMGMADFVLALTTLPNGELVAGGFFVNAGSVGANRIARWDGTAWSAMGSGMNNGVRALTTLPNGDLVAGGFFTTAGGADANYIARWNGAAWSPLGSGMNQQVHALTTLPNGDLVAGGDFTTAGGVNANHIALWDGTTWAALGSGTDGIVLALTTLPNGDLVAGGQFLHAGGVTVNRIARWDGATWTALASGVSSSVRALTTLQTGDLVAGGEFFTAGGVSVERIARLTRPIDLAIVMSDGLTTALVGQTITYTINVTNNAPCDAIGATVVDMFPRTLTNVMYTSMAIGGATGNTAMGDGDIKDTVTMPAGSAIAYIATGTLGASAAGTLENTATVTPPPGVIDSNPANNTATDSVEVLTPQQAIIALLGDVNALVTAGLLNGGQGNGLSAKLLAALRSLEQNRTNAACNQLRSFINHVGDLIDAAVLTNAEGQPLIDVCVSVRAALNCRG